MIVPRRPLNLAEVPVPVFCKQFEAVKAYEPELGPAYPHPETEAISFYLTQHVAAALDKAGTKDTKFHRMFIRVLRRGTARIAHYLLLICARESRHMGSDQRDIVKQEFGQGIVTFTDVLVDDAQTAVAQFQQSPPDIALGEYSDFLVRVFTTGAWATKKKTGYGGRKWGQVATALQSFVYGRMSPEILLDTAFSLQHNGGSIFNKGMLFNMWTAALGPLLDAQREGGIPRMVSKRVGLTDVLQPWHALYLEEAYDVLGDEPLGITTFEKEFLSGMDAATSPIEEAVAVTLTPTPKVYSTVFGVQADAAMAQKFHETATKVTKIAWSDPQVSKLFKESA